ncbi:hypothetical protein CK203_070475 [Vitis vinifera]|uniref:Uncharacterized protein n=1 Tax=Vitis vinifera TaxID=29760 RepID=A0A438FAR5_VITVI|nr:hypothetical protein CK203_070475 [Vitis vinifera]
MGRIFVVEFERNSETMFFCCGSCGTGIAHRDKLAASFTSPDDPGIKIHHFDEIKNVVIGGPSTEVAALSQDMVVAADINCVTFHFNSIPIETINQIVLVPAELKLWNGTEMVDATTI